MKLTVANSPFASRVSRNYQVDDSDLEVFEHMDFRQAEFKAGDAILERGAELKQVVLLVSGWAIRCRYTPEGLRQIVHILLPGDIVTPSVFVAKRTDHGISALSDVVARIVEPREMQRVFNEAKTLAAAFWWVAEQEHGMLREQIVRLGRRSALQRIPHLFLELHRRLFLVGQATAESFILPLTQMDIADTLGLSNVHVNRTLKKLVSGGYIAYEGPVIHIHDSSRLAELCDFDLAHLHLDSTVAIARSKGVA